MFSNNKRYASIRVIRGSKCKIKKEGFMLLKKEKTETLKGLFSLAVLLCHVCSRSGVGANWGLGPIYTAMGFLSVSVFFSLSGYGLAFCYENKAGYLQTFFRNRVVPLYVLSVFFIALYAILKWVLLGSIEVNQIISSFFIGNTVVSNGWYLQVILLFYILFFVIYSRNISIVSKKIYMFASIAVYIIISVMVGLSSTWWECALCFFLGFILYDVNLVRKEISCGALIASALFILSFVLYYSFAKGWMDGWMDGWPYL